MSAALKIINNVRTLRAQARELTLETLEEMLEKLTIVVEERREEEASFLKQQEEKQAKLEAVRSCWKMAKTRQNYFQLLAHLLPRPERNAPHVQLSINTSIPMVLKKHGQVRAELLVLSLLPSKPVRRWKISRSNNLHTKSTNPLAHRWRFYS